MADNIWGGLAQGLDSGVRLGLLSRAQNVNEQEAERQAEAQKAALAKQKFDMNKEKLHTALNIFKELPPASQELAFEKTIKPAAAELGYDISGFKLDDNLKETFENVNKLFKLNADGVLTDDQLQKGLSAEAAAHLGKNKEVFGQIDTLSKGVQSSIDNKTRAASKENDLEGSHMLGEFATREFLKKALSLNDQKITEGQKAGKVPKNLSVRAARALAPKGMTFNFGGAGAGGGSQQGGLNADSFSEANGF